MGIRTLLKNRRFVLLWLTQFFVTMGDTLFNISVLVTVFERTQSTLQTALVSVAVTAPGVLFAPFAGVLVDRFPRRAVLVGVNAARLLMVSLVFWFLAPDTFNLPGIYIVVFALAIVGTVYRPAISATIPSLVEKERLVQANSLIMATNQAVWAVGYIAGGILLVSVGVQPVVVLTAMSYGVGALLVALIHFAKRLPERDHHGPPPIFRAIVEGLRYLRGHNLARSLLTMEAIEYWPHGLWSAALMLAFTTQAVGGGTVEYGYQGASYFVGQWVGGVAAVALASRLARRAGWIIIINAFSFGVLTIAYALSPNVWVAIALCFIFGPPAAVRDVTQESLLQATIDPEMRGRVSATKEMLGNLFYTLGSLLFAGLADQYPVRWVYFLGGGLYLITALYAFLNTHIRSAAIEAAVTPLAPETVIAGGVAHTPSPASGTLPVTMESYGGEE